MCILSKEDVVHKLSKLFALVFSNYSNVPVSVCPCFVIQMSLILLILQFPHFSDSTTYSTSIIPLNQNCYVKYILLDQTWTTTANHTSQISSYTIYLYRQIHYGTHKVFDGRWKLMYRGIIHFRQYQYAL